MNKLKSKKPREFNEEEKEIFERLENFESFVYKVHDGDTISVKIPYFEFLTPMRFLGTDAPELSEKGGDEARDYLEKRISKKKVLITLGKQKEEKWGRMLGRVMHEGIYMDEEMIMMGFSAPFDRRDGGKFPAEAKAWREEGINKDFNEERRWRT